MRDLELYCIHQEEDTTPGVAAVSVENRATTEGTNGPSDEMQPANDRSAENDQTEESEGEDIAEEDVQTRPQHQRRPPQILTCNSMGNPQYQCVEPVITKFC